MASVAGYFERFCNGDATVPNGAELLPLAEVLDKATATTVNDLIEVLRSSPEHLNRVQLLKAQDRTAGKFSTDKLLFEGTSPFEQMVAISDWLAQKKIRDKHTFFLAPVHSTTDEDRVPLSAKKFGKVDANMMHVMLGSTRGNYKAPKYETWAQADPWQDPTQKMFIYPLEGLEIVRQPGYSAATVLKGNAFESELIESDWRYGAKFACVESKNQKANSLEKKRSAGLNACALVHKLCDPTDPQAMEKDMAIPILYENYTDEQYSDDLDTSVSSGQVIKAAKEAIIQQNSAPLTHLMQTLTIAKLGVPQTPALRERIVQILR